MKRVKRLLSILISVILVLMPFANVKAAEVDTQAPIVSYMITPRPNALGWNVYVGQEDIIATDNVGLAFIGYKLDDGEAVEIKATETSARLPLFIREDGKHVLTYWAKDLAGNISEVKAQNIKIDGGLPTIKGAATSAPNENGWYNGDVTVHFEGTDTVSGIYNITPDIVLSQEGLNNSATGTAEDYAGNKATTTVNGINIDKLSPAVTGEIITKPNENGWYNGDVTVHFTAADALSGVDTTSITQDITLATEGKDLSAEGSAKDLAGNTGNAIVNGINIDKLSPVVTGQTITKSNQNGWYNGDVTVHFTATDALSGVDATSITQDIILASEGRSLSAEGSAKDLAGNTGNTTVSGINIDKLSPVVTGETINKPNQNGWYNGNVTVHFTAIDELSGVDATSITQDITLSAEGKNLSAEGSAKDLAGNTGNTTVSGVNIDTTVPYIELNGVADGGNVYLNQSAGWTAFDSTSGLATASSGKFNTSTVGPKTATITATDLAGNTKIVTINYTVGYNLNFALKNTKKLDVVKQGSNLTVKFQLTDANGNYVDTAVAKLTLIKADGTEIVAVSTNNTATNQFRYDYEENQYVYNLSTKNLPKDNYTLKIALDNITTYTITISLK